MAALRIGRNIAAGVRNLKERASSSADSAPPNAIPYVVETVISHIERKELDLEGIFRISGSVNDVKTLKANLEKRRMIDLAKVPNPHTVTGVLKLWLRELQKPPMTFELYEAWRAVGNMDIKKQFPLMLTLMKETWRALPAANQTLLTRLFNLLHEVSKHSEQNKMPPPNLAIVFGPTLLRPEQETVETMLGDAEAIARIVESYITQAPTLLDGASPSAADLANAPAVWTDAFSRGRARLDATASLKTSASAVPSIKPPAPSSNPMPQSPSSPRAVIIYTPEEQAAIKIQSLWRGAKVRRRISNLPGGRSLASAMAIVCARLKTRHMGLVSCIAELKSYAAIMRSSLSLVPSTSPLAAAAAARAASSSAGQGPVALSEPLAVEAEVRIIFNGVDSINEAHLAIQARLNKLTSGLPWELREPGAALEECCGRLDAWDEFRAGFAAARRTLMFVMHSRNQSKRWMETMQGRSVSGLHLLDLLHEPVRQLVEHARLVAGLRDALLRYPHRPYSIDTYRALRAAAMWQRVAQAGGHVDNMEAEQDLVMTEKAIVGAKEAGFIVRVGRRLIRKGEVKIASEKRFVFLFNDLCLVTKQEGLSYHFKYVVELMGASVISPPRAGGKHAELSIELATPDRPYLIVLRSADECKAWVKDLENVTAHIASRLVGVPLEDLLTRDRRPTSSVPRAFEFLLEQFAQPTASLFSLQPSADDVRSLRECLERGVESDLVRRAKEAGAAGQHQVAALLCALLEALPEPLLPSPAPAPEVGALVSFVKGLSAPRFALLKAIVQIASRVPMPLLDVPSFRLLSLALLPSLSTQSQATIADALRIDATEQALALFIENPMLLSASPPSIINTNSLGQPSTWAAARLAAKANKPLPRAPMAPSISPSASGERSPHGQDKLSPASAPASLVSVAAALPPPTIPSPNPPPVVPPFPSVAPPPPPRSNSPPAVSSPTALRPLPSIAGASTKSPPTSPPRSIASPPRSAQGTAASTANRPRPTSPPASPTAGTAAPTGVPAPAPSPTTRRNVRPLPVPGSSGLTSPTRRYAGGAPPSLPVVHVEVGDEKIRGKRERGAPVVGELGPFIPEAK